MSADKHNRRNTWNRNGFPTRRRFKVCEKFARVYITISAIAQVFGWMVSNPGSLDVMICFSNRIIGWHPKVVTARWGIQSFSCHFSIQRSRLQPGSLVTWPNLFQFRHQEVEHVKIRQIREGGNREGVAVNGAIPEMWFGMRPPESVERDLQKLMIESMKSYMTSTFGVRKTFYLQLQQSNLAYLIKMPNLLSILFCIFKRIAQPCLFLFIFGLFKQTFSN